jgi:hypothetical protein
MKTKRNVIIGFTIIAMLGLLALSSLAFAGPSTNYDLLLKNDDGTFSIVGPHFRAPDGGNLKISYKSNYTGICRLFGFQTDVDYGAVGVITFRDPQTVLINVNGKFDSYDYDDCLSDGGCFQEVIHSLICQ